MEKYRILDRDIEITDAVYNFSYYHLKFLYLYEIVMQKFNNDFFLYTRTIDEFTANAKNLLSGIVNVIVEGSVEILNQSKIYDIGTEVFLKTLESGAPYQEWEQSALNIRRSSNAPAAVINPADEVKKSPVWSGYGAGRSVNGLAVSGVMNAFTGTMNSVSYTIQTVDENVKVKAFKVFLLKNFYTKSVELIANIVQESRDIVVDALKTRSGMEFYIPSQDEYDSSCGYLESLSKKVISPDEIPDYVQNLIMKFPYNSEVYKFITEEFGDVNNVIGKLTHDLNYGNFIDLVKVNRIKSIFKNAVNEISDLASATEFRNMFNSECKKLNADPDKYDIVLGKIVAEFNRCEHTCDGILYSDDAEYKKAVDEYNEFAEIIKKIDTSNETSLLNAKQKISLYTSGSARKYADFISGELEDYDLRYRTVEGKVHETRESADAVKSDILSIKQIKLNTDYSNTDSIREAAAKLSEKNYNTPRKVVLTEFLNKCIELSEKQNYILTHGMKAFRTRLERTDVLYQMLLLKFESTLYSVENSQFKDIVLGMNDDFCTVASVRYDSILESNKVYYKKLSHAYSYEKNNVIKSDEKKNIFSKIIGKTKETISKGYQDDYNYFSSNGTMKVPEGDVDDTIKIKDMKEVITFKDNSYFAGMNELKTNRQKYDYLDNEWTIAPGHELVPEKIQISFEKPASDFVEKELATLEL